MHPGKPGKVREIHSGKKVATLNTKPAGFGGLTRDDTA